MQLPIVSVAPLVKEHCEIFRSVFANQKQVRHFENYVTGLMVLDDKSMANMARCILDSADKTNVSRYLSEAPWRYERLNDKRVSYMQSQTAPHQRIATESVLGIDDTLCEHVGNLFEYVDNHYNHSNGQYPLAHNLVTSHYVSGAVRYPVDASLYRRYEEFTNWEAFVEKHFPVTELPKKKKERTALHKQVDSHLLTDPAFRALDEAFKTKITIARELVEKALDRKLAFGWVLFDGWYLAPDFLAVLERLHKDWVSILKHNRNLETNSFRLRDADGNPIAFDEPQIKVEALVPYIPQQAYKPITVDGRIYYTFTMTVRMPSIGKVRIVVSFDNPERRGNYVVLVTNRTDCSALRIIATYLLRWPIETFYQDGKQLLGLDEYRMRTAQAFQKHWSLVFVAYSLLHLDCLDASLPKMQRSPNKSIGEATRQQVQSLMQDLILTAHNALIGGQEIAHVFNRLFAKQLIGTT
ncbi:MAG: transposase [Anaerolineae bacterium]|nr:transposase [Anaerolineae bacterium]